VRLPRTEFVYWIEQPILHQLQLEEEEM